KSGVLKTNFYEPEIQREYAEMLKYYGSSPITCKVRYPQEKGKVESGVKYVKNNFFKSLKEDDYYKAAQKLKDWQDNKCNQRIHVTTRKVPLEQFIGKEKEALLSLPIKPYEVFDISERVVNNYGHITYRYNFYSVPYIYVGKKVTIKNNSKILKIYDESYNEVAVHTLSDGTGEFITNKAHNPRLTQTDYENKSLSIGSNV
ncbi:IS21 family transposase, partial [Deferribacterales bacterium Es71-Z0220]|uniref:Mu transposase domain-containing protein n=1 Tax=Deferrivibrio essentukiensis TaxID=2880922 RepID=UPI003BF96505|nr:IS21 family transposase [Deferrivibrio essentukiensis]